MLVLRVQPDEGFSLHIESKVPGHGMELQPVAMDYSYGGTLYELPFSAYETVLVDVMEGDMTLFTRGDRPRRRGASWSRYWRRGAGGRRPRSPCTRPEAGAPRRPTRCSPSTAAPGASARGDQPGLADVRAEDGGDRR